MKKRRRIALLEKQVAELNERITAHELWAAKFDAENAPATTTTAADPATAQAVVEKIFRPGVDDQGGGC